MDYFEVTKKESGFHIEGFPNAVKVIQLDSKKARRVADMALHKEDLEFAAECLNAINSAAGQRVVRRALWRSAILHFVKCFGANKGRPSSLDPARIYKGYPLALENFDYFKTFRDKNVVHDENSYVQSIPGAILNKEKHTPKIEKIVCFAAVGETLEQNNFSNLGLLINKARDWVTAEFDRLCEDLTQDLEAQSYEDLYAKPFMTYSKPRLDDIRKNRNAL